MFYQVAPRCIAPDSNIVFGTCNANFLQHKMKKKEMFASKVDGSGGSSDNLRGERKMSSSSSGFGGSSGGGMGGGGPGGGMKTKWVKAFKSIKGGKEPPEASRHKNGSKDNNGSVVPANVENSHIFQEYTYKKVTPCDICSQILRGHTRQGLKCKLCRMNVHPDCQDDLPRCQPKSRLLRRQRSASEVIDAGGVGGGAGGGAGPSMHRVAIAADDDDRHYDDSSVPSFPFLHHHQQQQQQQQQSNGRPGGGGGLGGHDPPSSSSIVSSSSSSRPNTAPHNMDYSNASNASSSSSYSQRGGMSLSGSGGFRRSQQPNYSPSPSSHVSSPSSGISGTVGVGGPSNTLHIASSTIASSSAPSSPVHNRRLLSAAALSRNAAQQSSGPTSRMSSVDLPDDNEKSVSSASTSPCPSPKSHRHLPSLQQPIYIILYNFIPRAHDELELKAGHRIYVLDSSDSDWWKGKFNGSVGYFPSTYVTRLLAGEKVLQVIKPAQIDSASGGGGGGGGMRGPPIELLKDQIVIQIGEELRNATVLIRNAENRQGLCPTDNIVEIVIPSLARQQQQQ